MAQTTIASHRTPPLTRAKPDRERVASIDIIRGVVMLLMALDHARVYFAAEQLGALRNMSTELFLTRWITHFCAPAFIFLAGTAAYLKLQRSQSKTELSRYLAIRGLILILLELTIIRWSWTFNLAVGTYNLAGVIWVIGWCMIGLAALLHLNRLAIGIFAFVVIALHNLIPSLLATSSAGRDAAPSWLKLLYVGGEINIGGGIPLIVLYTIIPWIGVMTAGFLFGSVMTLEPQQRKRYCIRLASGLILAFIVLRTTNLYGNPTSWEPQGDFLRSVLAFINTAKYPASLQFLLMTIGPTILFLALVDRKAGRVSTFLQTFGKTPFVFYLLHIPLLHLMAIVTSLIVHRDVPTWFFGNHPLAAGPPPAGYAYSIAAVWVAATAAAVLLYLPCRWVAQKKRNSLSRWLSYL